MTGAHPALASQSHNAPFKMRTNRSAGRKITPGTNMSPFTNNNGVPVKLQGNGPAHKGVVKSAERMDNAKIKLVSEVAKGQNGPI